MLIIQDVQKTFISRAQTYHNDEKCLKIKAVVGWNFLPSDAEGFVIKNI